MKLLASVCATATLALAACGDSGGSNKPGPDGGVAVDASPAIDVALTRDAPAAVDTGVAAEAMTMFTAWEQARAALQQSPDHLPGRAAALVAAGDPAKLFQFVRDEIVTYPPSDDGFYGCVTAQRWGTAGTLRGGAGTPREKAELLVSLYTRAGLAAQVVGGVADPARLDGKSVLLRTYPRTYAPPISTADEAAWRQALGHGAPTARPPIDPTGGEAAALAASLLPLLPADAGAPFDFTLSDIPLVRVSVNGVPTYANPIAPTATFGESLTLATPTPVSAADAPQRVLVRLEGARADDPFKRFTLLEHTYDAADVVGRRIHLGFAPTTSPEQLASVRLEDVETLVPVMNVAAPGMTQADRDRLAVVGDAFSRGGDQYHLDAAGVLSANGVKVATSAPGAQASVASVGVSARGDAFPRVGVSVSARTAAGASVPGLGADAITVTDNGAPVSFSVSQNQAPPPRVVLLFDTSTSVPVEFRGAGAVGVAQNIVDALYARYPTAEVRVGTILIGVEWMGTSWATTQTEASAQVAALATAAGSSEIWQAVSEAEAQHPTLIVLSTDGDSTDVATPEFENAIAAGAPVLALGVGTVVPDSLAAIAGLSGGTYLPVTAQSEAEQAVATMVAGQAKTDYALSFTATSMAPGPHTVAVTINGVTATTTYEVPSTPVTPPALSGLYLTLRVGTREATRAVAGFSSGFTTATPVIGQAVLDDVTGMLFGRISIAVEAAGPPASVVLDDWLAEKATLQPLWDAVTSGDQVAVSQALHAGLALTPSILPLAQPPLREAASATGLTFETGPRVATLVQKLRGGKTFARELDLFPMNRWSTAAADGRTGWVKTFTATAGLAVTEAHLMNGGSTLAALAGQSLAALPAGQASLQDGLADSERLRWGALEEPFSPSQFTLLVPLRPGAFWAVDNGTGTLTGLLPDGSGGAVEDACSNYDLANSCLQMASLLGSLFGVSVGGWVALAQWEVKYVTIADIVISGGNPAPGTTGSNPVVDMGCGMLDDALGNFIPGVGTYEGLIGTLDTIGVDTGAPTVCGGGQGPCGP